MSNEQLGIVAEGIHRREIYGRFINPKVVPFGPAEVARPYLVKIAKLEAEIGQLSDTNADLVRRIAVLRNQLARAVSVPRPKREPRLDEEAAVDLGMVDDFIPRHEVTVQEVQEDFLARLKRHNYRVNGDLLTLEMLFASARRQRGYVMARHICIFAVRRICPALSLNRMGMAFGGMDHTTCIHAIGRAPHWVALYPLWAPVLREMFETFGEVSDAPV